MKKSLNLRKKKKNILTNYSLLKIIKKCNPKKEIIITWYRAFLIVPFMMGNTISIYNGKGHLPIYIVDHMIEHKLGEFIPTRIASFHNSFLKKKKEL
uniref:Small ribosomal subunit protein uS19c n=1 Tax=Sciaphila thaidanica TaxID=2161793 RepID=A0A2R4PAM7_9LILI|nr:ribosomal protein S19 [Sciaphila thaidanica]